MIKYQVTCYLAHHLSPKTDHFLHQQLHGNHSLQTGLVCPLTDPAACFIKKKNTELIHSSRQDSMHSCGNLNFGQQSILPKYRMRLRIYLITYFLAIYINQQASGQCSVQVSCFQPSKVPIIQQENCLPNHRTKFYYIIFFFNTPQFQLW